MCGQRSSAEIVQLETDYGQVDGALVHSSDVGRHPCHPWNSTRFLGAKQHKFTFPTLGVEHSGVPMAIL